MRAGIQLHLDNWARISGAIFSARYACPASLGCTPSGPIRSGLPTNQPSLIGSMNVAPIHSAWVLRVSRTYKTSNGGLAVGHGGPGTRPVEGGRGGGAR